MTYLCGKMIAEQRRYAADSNGNPDLLWKQISNDWSDPTAARALPAALNRTGAAYNRALIMAVAWFSNGRPGRDSSYPHARCADQSPLDSSAHELCDDDRAALDAFMAGGL